MQYHFLCLARCQLAFFKRQLKLLDIPEYKQLEIIGKLIDISCNLDKNVQPVIAGSEMFMVFCQELKMDDPLRNAKQRQNEKAMKLLPLVESLIESEEDHLLAAIKSAASGNIIDVAFGDEFDVENALRQSMEEPFSISEYEEFIRHLSLTSTLTIVTDNAGEIALDRILIEHIQKWRLEHKLPVIDITVLVKGAPIYNDAMREDALFVGIDKESKIVDTGAGYFGIQPAYMAKEAIETLRNSDIIITKGLANHESSFEEVNCQSAVFDLFLAKCELIAEELHVPVNSSVFMKHCKETSKGE